MPPPNKKQPPQCWECLRRQSACDGTQPVCKSCHTAGLVCPGYGDRRPLTWLAPGKVARGRNSRTISAVPTPAAAPAKSRPAAAAAANRSARVSKQSAAAGGGKGSVVVVGGGAVVAAAAAAAVAAGRTYSTGNRAYREEEEDPSLAVAIRRQSWINNVWERHSNAMPMDLRPQEWDIVEAFQFYNTQFIPHLASNKLRSSKNITLITSTVLHGLSPSWHYSMVSISLGLRLSHLSRTRGLGIDPATSRYNEAVALSSSFYRYVGLALRTLNEEINEGCQHLEVLFSSVHQIIVCELLLPSSSSWRPHIDGFLSIINQCGGLRKVMASPRASTYALLSFIVDTTLLNSTSPQSEQITQVSQFNILDLHHLYTIHYYQPFPCPIYLFLDIVRINRLRLQTHMNNIPAAAASPTEYPYPPRPTPSSVVDLAVQPSANTTTTCDILRHIDSFSPDDWVSSADRPNPNLFFLIARVFQASIALYAILSLPCTSESSAHISTPCEKLHPLYHELIFHLLSVAFESSVPVSALLWPLSVAGVAATKGTPAQRALVKRYLREAAKEPFVGMMPLVAFEMLQRFWDSGKSSWDECFDRPYVLVV